MATYLGGKHTYSDSASGVLYTDRRQFYLNNKVAELYPEATPFLAFVNKLKVENKPDDPEFKMFTHESQWVDMDFYSAEAINWDASSWDGTYDDWSIDNGAGVGVGFLQKGDIIEIKAASAGTRNTGNGGSGSVAANQVIARCVITDMYTVASGVCTAISVENLSYTGADTYDVADNDLVRVISSAATEGSTSTDGWNDELSVVWNQTQIIKSPYKVSNTIKAAVLRGYPDELMRLRSEHGKFHNVKINNAFLRGYAMKPGSLSTRATAFSAFTDPNSDTNASGEQIRATWGIIPLLETYGTANEQVFSRQWASYDVDAFIDDMTARQKYFNSDKVVEYAFAGRKFMAELSKTGPNSFMARSGGSFELLKPRDTAIGFQIRTLVHPFGMIHIALDPSLRDDPYTNMMVIVNPEDIGRVIYRPDEFQAGIQANDADHIKEQYLSDTGLVVSQVKKHALFKMN